MRFIATILVDLERSPLGTRSRLGDDLCGKTVLRRTVERVLAARRLDAVHVLSPVDQSAEVSRLLEGLDVIFETHDAAPPAYAALVRAGRWWCLDGWRGGIGGMCAFDEDIHVPLLAALGERVAADGVVSIPAAAAVIDPALIDAMVAHYQQHEGVSRMTFVQAPPGMGPVVLDRKVLQELAPARQPPGLLLTYHPDRPQPDLTGKEACYRPAAEIIEAGGRLICDTRRSFDRVRDLLKAGGEGWEAARVASWLSTRGRSRVDPVPAEIEIELTTDDPLAEGSILRPRGSEVGRRGPLALESIRRIIAAIGDYDDVRIVLGGFGEPCCHPQFGEICRILHDSAAAAVAVRTGAMLDDPAIGDALLETPVDVVEVTIDATTAETYRRVYGVDGFDRLTARIEGWLARRSSGQQVLPLIVPSLVKANETFEDIEAFFDTWQRRLGTSLITGYSHCGGQRPRRAVTSMAPTEHGACRRVFSRVLVLADGRLTTCDQDFAGRQAVGDVGQTPLEELWGCERLADIRANRYNGLPLCPTCDEWHRP